MWDKYLLYIFFVLRFTAANAVDIRPDEENK